jgi:hypothetical protein
MNNVRITKLIGNVDGFLLKDLFRLAALLETEEMVLLNLVHQQHIAKKKGKIRK